MVDHMVEPYPENHRSTMVLFGRESPAANNLTIFGHFICILCQFTPLMLSGNKNMYIKT